MANTVPPMDALRSLPANAPVTARQVSSTITALATQADEARGQVYELVNKNFQEFVTTYNDAADMHAELASLSKAVQEAEQLVASGPLSKMASAALDHEHLATAVEQTQKTVVVLEQLCLLNEALNAIDSLLENGDLVGAATKLVEANGMLRAVSPSDEDRPCDPKIFSVVRRELRRKRALVKSLVEEMWRSGVVWHREQGPNLGLEVMARVSGWHGAQAEASLSEVVQSLHLLGLADKKLEQFAGDLLDVLVKPLIDVAGNTPTVASTAKTTSLTLRAAAKGTKARKSKTKRNRGSSVDLASLYQKILDVVRFVLEQLFGLTEETPKPLDDTLQAVLESLEAHFVPPLCDMLIEKVLAKAVPDMDSEGDQASHAELTETFEKTLRALHVCRETPTTLSSYVGDAGLHAGNKKRQDILFQARELLLSNNFNTIKVSQETERGGFFPSDPSDPESKLEESLYRLPACHISVVTHSVVELAYSFLSEMGGSSPEAAVQMFYSVRDMFDLFRAVMPVQHQEMFSTVPQMAAVFHNDCFYIAHHLLSLGHQFRSSLPEEMAHAATFVDMVPAFQELGEQHMMAIVDKEMTSIQQCVQESGGFGGTHDQQKYQSVQRVLKQLFHQLSLLAKVWGSGILAEGIFNTVIGSLTNAAVATVVHEVLALADISEQETHQLFDLLGFTETSVLNKVWQCEADQDLPADVLSFVPVWPKFRFVRHCLKSSLAEITDEWQRGQRALAADELAGLVRALFSNTDRRAKALQLIR
eukprot:m.241060 g.241060  ORF g.241060 m.241060 type:complete len:761 (+) comp18993_c0_seq1:124-2406(+)